MGIMEGAGVMTRTGENVVEREEVVQKCHPARDWSVRTRIARSVSIRWNAKEESHAPASQTYLPGTSYKPGKSALALFNQNSMHFESSADISNSTHA